MRLQLERGLLCAQPLLQPRQLGPAGEQLLLEVVAPDAGRASAGADAGSAVAASSRPPAWTVRGRCTSITTATATAAATSAANTISISVSSHGARSAGLNTQFR